MGEETFLLPNIDWGLLDDMRLLGGMCRYLEGGIGSRGLTSCYHRLGTAGRPAGQALEVLPGGSFANLSQLVSKTSSI